ncbi:Flp pilus assembly protein CpaB [Zhongshania borealis]|uniref:Flp pilus assembly protein CpaB n=1 Tax=Zhongshania borealis TaxID=889488 RepID=A0ABP7WFV6_9GAMM
MQARTLKIIAALLIISAVFMGVIGYKISQEDSTKTRTPANTTPATEASNFTYAQKLLIVNRGFNEGEVITAEDVQLVPYPLLIEDSFSKVEDIINRRLESKIPLGAVVRQSHFENQSKLSQYINPGYRALAIKVNETSSAGGFLQPGDRVDVIFTTRASKETYNKSMSRRLLQNIRLLAFGTDVERDDKAVVVDDGKKSSKSKEDKSSGKSSRSAVLEIALDDIAVLTLAEESGELRLVALGDTDMLEENTDVSTADPSPITTKHISDADKTAFIRDVTGLKPPPAPKSVYVYSGDSVETIKVRN